MTSNEIQKLITFIAGSGLDEVSIETENLKIAVKRYSATVPVPTYGASTQPTYQQQVVYSNAEHLGPDLGSSSAATDKPNQSAANHADAAKANQFTIKSPMIGTFYRSASPENPVFTEVGDEIKIGQTLCIIEAMKLFNEIESEISGRIVKILVANATPVEYDQPLFVVELF